MNLFFSQRIHFNPTLIIGRAQPDVYQRKMCCWHTTSITNSVADTNWPMNTEVDSIQTFWVWVISETGRFINYNHVKTADEKKLGVCGNIRYLFIMALSRHNLLLLQVKFLCKWQCLSFNPRKQKLNDVFLPLELQQVGYDIAKSAHCSLKNQFFSPFLFHLHS